VRPHPASLVTLPTALRLLGKGIGKLASGAPNMPARDVLAIGAVFADLLGQGAGGGGHPLTRFVMGAFYTREEAAPLLAKLDARGAEAKPAPAARESSPTDVLTSRRP
jgi:hypothetical protein